MNKLFYPRLAATNIKKNSKIYIPYILSCAGTVILYYVLYALYVNKDIEKVAGSEHLKSILSLGTYVIAIFSVIFLFYTSSFLIKRRKKEFGLFNILGMEKKHISKIMLFETLYIAIISLAIGISGGIVLNKLMYLILLKLLNFEAQMRFHISVSAIIASLTLFGIIFVLTFLNTLRQIHFSKPIELLKGGQTGEKEPKTKWLLTSTGILTLGTGYFIAMTTESPLAMIGVFFIAVILVIIGTYCLFTAGSIAVLKLLRKSSSYYYKTRHFTSLSGMIYRMKQNAAGLANICILSTAVLVMLSTTISLYAGMEDVLRTRYPRNIIINAKNVAEQQAGEIGKIITEEAAQLNTTMYNVLQYRFMYFLTKQEKDSFIGYDSNDTFSGNSDNADITCIPLAEYNRMQGCFYTLSQGEVLLYTAYGSIEGNTITIGDLQLSVKSRIDDLKLDDSGHAMVNTYYFIVPDTNTIESIYLSLADNPGDMGELSYYYGFDSTADRDTQIDLVNVIQKRVKELGVNGYTEGAEKSRESFYSLYGGLLFIGIFLGVLFIMATVLIIYYKQISEGYDDKERFEIMQKVGMSRDEVKASIRSQVLTVFFLPLITAGIHIAFAFKAITKMLAVLNLMNVTLFAWVCAGTLLVFGVLYAIVYALTSKVYYKIVSGAQ